MVHNASTENEQAARASFALCADDYALSPAVSEGVLRLLEMGRLSATGAMTNRPAWRTHAGSLKPFADRADLGLHLNLTCGAPLGAMPTIVEGRVLPSVGRLARLALLSPGARREIAAEIERQLDTFEAELGRPPDFVDGHQHVHGLPGVGTALIGILTRRYGTAARLYVRDPSDRGDAIRRRPAAPKAMTVRALTAGFGERARRAGLKTNRGFSGFSAFDPAADYRREFAGALISPGPAHLVMCHPGEIDDELRRADAVVETRPRELAFFAGDEFLALCEKTGLRLSRMSDMLGSIKV